MRPIGGIVRTTAAAAGPIGRGRLVPSSEGTGEAGAGRALIAVAPATPGDPPPATSSRRPSANFLAQLIATAQQAPQTRVRRRADPAVAITSYRAAAADLGAPVTHRLVRSC
jgi:hypothetical protein